MNFFLIISLGYTIGGQAPKLSKRNSQKATTLVKLDHPILITCHTLIPLLFFPISHCMDSLSCSTSDAGSSSSSNPSMPYAAWPLPKALM